MKGVVPGLKKGKEDEPEEATITSEVPRPTLNIAVMVIGSRGDIQPFLKLGESLKNYGHRVRIATHPAFKDLSRRTPAWNSFLWVVTLLNSWHSSSRTQA